LLKERPRNERFDRLGDPQLGAEAVLCGRFARARAARHRRWTACVTSRVVVEAFGRAASLALARGER
jgi:hypothetical protein